MRYIHCSKSPLVRLLSCVATSSGWRVAQAAVKPSPEPLKRKFGILCRFRSFTYNVGSLIINAINEFLRAFYI